MLDCGTGLGALFLPDSSGLCSIKLWVSYCSGLITVLLLWFLILYSGFCWVCCYFFSIQALLKSAFMVINFCVLRCALIILYILVPYSASCACQGCLWVAIDNG